MDELIYLGGRIIPAGQAAVPVCEHGLLYGNGIFETMAVYNGKVFSLAGHLARLYAGAEALDWPPLPDAATLADAIAGVLAANKLTNCALRLSAYRGTGPLAPDDTSCGSPLIIIAPRRLPPPDEERRRRGWSLVTSTIRRNDTSPLAGVKSANYLDNLLAKKAARAAGADDALLLSTRGLVAETSAANIFAVCNDMLTTPDLASGALPGVTRATVLRLARESGLAVAERPVDLAELAGCSELFVTNSLVGLMPVTSLDGRKISDGPGPVATMLTAKFRELIAAETGAAP